MELKFEKKYLFGLLSHDDSITVCIANIIMTKGFMYLPGISISNPGFIVFGEASSKKKVKLMIMGMALVMFMLKLIVMLIGMVRVTGTTMVMVGMFMNCCY